MSMKNENIEKVECKGGKLIVSFADGREIATPLNWYPRLLKATAKQRKNWEICGAGRGIHWPDVDEDLSIAGMMEGNPAVDYYYPKKLQNKTQNFTTELRL